MTGPILAAAVGVVLTLGGAAVALDFHGIATAWNRMEGWDTPEGRRRGGGGERAQQSRTIETLRWFGSALASGGAFVLSGDLYWQAQQAHIHVLARVFGVVCYATAIVLALDVLFGWLLFQTLARRRGEHAAPN